MRWIVTSGLHGYMQGTLQAAAPGLAHLMHVLVTSRAQIAAKTVVWHHFTGQ
jgi:hypothetical protein